jgi:predicted ABC-type ATPase
MTNTPRLRLVAGPNGAGKSTFTEKLLKKQVNLGIYVNPDEIAKTLTGDEWPRAKEAQQIAIRQRKQLLYESQSMTYESVMSHHSHIDFLKQAKEAGYRTYLYFIGLESPSLSEDRVREREKNGGHGVPPEKIAPRYHRVMNQLVEACLLVDRAYIFDNSYNYSLIAEIHDGECTIREENPAVQFSWFQKYFVEKLSQQQLS